MRTFILVSHRRGPSFCLAYPTERGPSIIVSHPLVVLTTWHFLSHQSWARLDLVLVHHRTEVLIRLHSTKNSDSNARRTITPAVALHMARDAFLKIKHAYQAGLELPQLRSEDLRVRTAILGAAQVGQRNTQLPWIWSFGTTVDQDGTWMDECRFQ